jgi:hypothetical protein
MKTCFIVMPITTPADYLPKYQNDEDHFIHVLEHLFVPSIEKAELKPVRPTAAGAEVIHGKIVKDIETSDLVFCDMSTLNANVFFELGIRTAVNKPVCLVRDDVTDKIPFDTSIINHHVYLSGLNAWDLEKEIQKLSEHIKQSLAKSEDPNSLWKYFSLSSSARPLAEDKGLDAKIDYLTMQIEALRKQRAETVARPLAEATDKEFLIQKLTGLVRMVLQGSHAELWGIYIHPTTDDVVVEYTGDLSAENVEAIKRNLLAITGKETKFLKVPLRSRYDVKP